MNHALIRGEKDVGRVAQRRQKSPRKPAKPSRKERPGTGGNACGEKTAGSILELRADVETCRAVVAGCRPLARRVAQALDLLTPGSRSPGDPRDPRVIASYRSTDTAHYRVERLAAAAGVIYRGVHALCHACATRLARETGALAILVRRTAGPPGAMFSGGGTLDHIGTRGGARCSAHPDERHLRRVLTEYVAYDNHRRPHQGLDQRCPVPAASVPSDGVVERHDALGGVIHDYGPRAA